MALPPTFDARLVSARALSPSVRELSFERTDGAPFVFEPGQWVSFVLPNEGKELRRSYSIASPPDGDAALRRRRDPRRRRARDRRSSTRCSRGRWSPSSVRRASSPARAVDPPPSLFVATGTGVTPFRSMLSAAVAAGDRTPTWLLFGVRCEEDILYRKELGALAEEHAHIRFIPTLSQPGSEWTGRRGYVQTHVRELFEELAAASERPPHAYVCGLERMVGSVRELLRKEMGLPREQVHTERYD